MLSLLLAQAAVAQQNFVFFQPDEMRAESLGCYGHPVSKTPSFDSFAEEATRFEQAHVSYTVCSQSRVSFMTGWPTHVLGHRTLWALLHEWEPNLLKYLKTAGYNVQWWGKNDLLASDAWNVSVTSAMSYGGLQNGIRVGDNQTDPRFYTFLNEATSGDVTGTQDYKNVEAAIQFLNSKPTEPFAIFLPLMKPHPPYSVPEPFYSTIDPDSIPALRPSGIAGKPDYHQLIREFRNLTRLDDLPEKSDGFFRKLHAVSDSAIYRAIMPQVLTLVRLAWQVYLGSIAYSDFLFGLLLAAIDAAGFKNTTTVAVWSDHGDYAGDYGALHVARRVSCRMLYVTCHVVWCMAHGVRSRRPLRRRDHSAS